MKKFNLASSILLSFVLVFSTAPTKIFADIINSAEEPVFNNTEFYDIVNNQEEISLDPLVIETDDIINPDEIYMKDFDTNIEKSINNVQVPNSLRNENLKGNDLNTLQATAGRTNTDYNHPLYIDPSYYDRLLTDDADRYEN